jgi:hypothetical protein
VFNPTKVPLILAITAEITVGRAGNISEYLDFVDLVELFQSIVSP